jgi:hypothetical protein
MFKLYDFAFFAGKPAIMGPGMSKGRIYWEAQFFSGPDHSGMPATGALSAVGANALALNAPAGTPFCIDIESWKSYTVGGGDSISLADAKIAVQKYTDTIKGVKLASPGLEWGYFGAALPMEDGFYALSKSAWSSDLRGAALQKLVLQRKIAEASDILYPSCYAYTTSIAEWHKSFDLQIDMCKLLSPSCKVIPFIWPQYPPVVNGWALQFIQGVMWREMLEHCYERCDGAAIYAEQATTWANAYASNWWPATQNFIIDKQLIEG